MNRVDVLDKRISGLLNDAIPRIVKSRDVRDIVESSISAFRIMQLISKELNEIMNRVEMTDAESVKFQSMKSQYNDIVAAFWRNTLRKLMRTPSNLDAFEYVRFFDALFNHSSPPDEYVVIAVYATIDLAFRIQYVLPELIQTFKFVMEYIKNECGMYKLDLGGITEEVDIDEIDRDAWAQVGYVPNSPVTDVETYVSPYESAVEDDEPFEDALERAKTGLRLMGD